MTTAIKVFLGFAILPYPFVLLMSWFIRSEVDGLLGGFTVLAVIVVWLNLSVALLLVGIHNGIPWWSYTLAVPVIIIYLAAVYSVTGLLRTERVQWMIVVPAVGPLVMFAYIWWVTVAAKATAAKGGFVDVLQISDRYLGAIAYFADHKCPILDELTEYIAALRSSPDPKGKWTYEALDRIKLRLAAPYPSPHQQ